MSPRPSGSNGPAPVVLLASPGASTRILYHALDRAFGPIAVVLEAPMSRDARCVGESVVWGSESCWARSCSWCWWSRCFRDEDAHEFARSSSSTGLDTSEIDERTVVRVPSVNSDEAREALVELNPKVVVISANRIIGAKTLTCIGAPFLNVHAGITPAVPRRPRRILGARGGPARTGRHDRARRRHRESIRARSLPRRHSSPPAATRLPRIPISISRPGLPALLAATREVIEGRPLRFHAPLSDDEPSQLRSHPTLWGYLAARGR